jgi:fatty-acyl-CoA synthase
MRKTYGPGYPHTLGALMAWSELDPEAPAVTDAAGTLDRRAFQNRVLRFAAGLRRGGVGSGSRAALWLPNGSGYLAALFACARPGALAIHINTRFRTAEVGNLLRRSRAVVLVTQWGFAPVDFPAIVVALPVEDRAGLRCVLGLQLPPGMTQLAGLPVLSLDGDAADAGPDEATGEKPCLTFTTSGTTGGPKLVLHDQQTIAGHAADVARHIGLDAADAVLLGAPPFCGTFGNAAAMAAIAGGAHVVCLAQFDGEAAVGLIRQHRVTHVIGGDDMFGRIAAASGGRRFDSVRFSGFAAFHSSAAASIAAAEAAGMQPHGLYGSSEVQALFSVSEGENRLLGGGVPVSIQARLAVRDPKTGSTLPSGASGELWIDAPSRFIEYLEDPAQPNGRSTPMAFSAPVISPGWRTRASSMRRGSAMPCASVGSWSAPRRSRLSSRRNLAWRVYRWWRPQGERATRSQWPLFGRPTGRSWTRRPCGRVAWNSWRGSRCRSGSWWWKRSRSSTARTALKCRGYAYARWLSCYCGNSGTTSYAMSL